MAYQWSSESIVVEHKELQANAMALDPKGQFALLTGRRNIAVIDLDKPSEVLKRVTRSQQKYNVTALEWNPNENFRNMFAMAVGEKAEIFNWSHITLSEESSLKAHTRTITDLNWHRTEPNILVTCSIDTFLHIWDTRETRKPVLSLSAIAGASQVKWNKLNPDYFASGHDCDIRIWDRRKSSQPVCYINAHLSKIHSLDWSPNHETQIVSSSSDSTVKFFDITNPRKSELFINTQSPVWRARYTPFGESLMTVVVPPLRRGENSLLLWSLLDTSCPVHSFVGHSDIVLEFDWRIKEGAVFPDGFQLITWSKDNSLRIWKVDPQLLKICGHSLVDEEEGYAAEAILEASDTETVLGYENGDRNGGLSSLDHMSNQETFPAEQLNDALALLAKKQFLNTDEVNGNHSSEVTIKREHPKTLSLSKSARETVSQSPSTPGASQFLSITPVASDNSFSRSLQQEFASLNSSFDNVSEIVCDADKRTCQVTVKRGNFTAILCITFPAKYPNGICPTFRFVNGTNIEGTVKTELLRVLKSTALQYTSIKKKKGCLEPCLRIFITQLKALLTEERPNTMDISNLHVNSYFAQVYGGQQDYSIPFPRTSGARFNTAGFLVCFTRPTILHQGTLRERSTPRSLSALGAYVTSLMPQMSSASATSPQYNYLYPVAGQSPSTDQNVSIYMYYYQDRKTKNKRVKTEEEKSNRVGTIFIYDVSKLIPFSQELAATYVLDEGDVIGSCNKNKEAAANFGRKDLSQVWALVGSSLSIASSPAGSDEDFPWIHHPFGRKMVLSLIDHYHSRFDVQTAALLSCVLGQKTSIVEASRNKEQEPPWKKKAESTSSSGGSPYNTIHGLNTDSWELSAAIRHNRSNSEGCLVEVARPASGLNVPIEENNKVPKKTLQSLLDPTKSDEYNDIRVAYANILSRWDLLEPKALVNKFIREFNSNQGIEFQFECWHCGRPCRENQCHYCKRLVHKCAICRISIRGSSIFCLFCGHGGHTNHYLEWFSEFDICPAGCGCFCLSQMEELFDGPSKATTREITAS